MNTIIKTAKLQRAWLQNNAVLVTAIRNHFNKDYMPAPYPRTEKERAASAQKYGIPLEEYKPIPDDGEGAGDYPDFKAISGDSKDPFYPWDFPEVKRNFNEVMHRDFDAIREDRFDCNIDEKLPVSLGRMWFTFLGVLFGLFSINLICENFKMSIPCIPKQYPSHGKTHYTFEVEDN